MYLRYCSKRGMGLLLALIVCVAGCGQRGAAKLDLVPVSGSVTLDGKPLTEADVSFSYQGTDVRGFYGSGGRTDAQGRYQLRVGTNTGAVPGKYRVTVSRFVDGTGQLAKLEEGLDLEQLRQQGALKQTVPEKYTVPENTPLTITVERGKADGYDLPLASN